LQIVSKHLRYAGVNGGAARPAIGLEFARNPYHIGSEQWSMRLCADGNPIAIPIGFAASPLQQNQIGMLGVICNAIL
jgi:hypothetical protein